jgi:hypothetical protein
MNLNNAGLLAALVIFCATCLAVAGAAAVVVKHLAP